MTNQLSNLPNPLWVIDIEASGLSQTSYPIEIGATNGQKSFQSLIYPCEHWTQWDSEAEKIHHISRQALFSYGAKAHDVAIELNSLFHNCHAIYCDSLKWDGHWLKVLFSDTGRKPSFQLNDVKSLFERNPNSMDVYLSSKAKLESSGRYKLHSALDDAAIIHKALLLSFKR